MAVKISESTNIDKIQVQEQAPADVSGTPSSGYGWYYSGTAGIPYYKNDAGTQFDLSDTGGDMDNPMTTEGDVIYSSDGSGTPARLAVGSAGQFMTTDGTVPSWGDATTTTIEDDPLWNAEGDILYATGNDAGTVLPIGSANYVLTSDGTVPTWGVNYPGALSDWTPVVYQGGTVTATNTYSKYQKLSSNLIYVTSFLTATGNGAGNVDIVVKNLPETPATEGVYGIGYVLNAGVAWYVGAAVYIPSYGGISFRIHNGTDDIGADPAFTLANTDQIKFTVTYPY